jgi:hypothetical protein
MEPSASCYNGLLKAIVKSRTGDAGDRAEDVLRRMMPRAGPGAPDAVTYTTCISAWQESRHPEAVERAEALLKESWTLSDAASQRGVDLRARPNVKTFLSYLRVVMNSEVENKAERAEQVVAWMTKLGIRPSHDFRRAMVDLKSGVIKN